MYRITLFSLMIVLLGTVGCKSKDDPGSSATEFDRKAMLTHVSENIIQTNYTILNSKAVLLKQKALDYTNQPDVQKLTALRAELLDCQMAYQGCSTFEFGPAATHSLRSILNTYPTSTSIVESNITSGSYDLFSAGNIAAKGLPALEYLIFGDQKSDQEIIDLFTTDANHVNRKKYLNDVAEQIATTTTNVYNGWNGEGYDQTFVNSDGTAVGSSTGLWINALVLDFERYIRDGKVGIPVGVRSLGTPNPEKTEAYYSAKSLELLKESLTQYKNAFNGVTTKGVNGLSLDDYLTHVGSGNTAQNINNQIDLALEKINTLAGPLSQDVVDNKQQVKAAYDELQKAIVLLKVEMPSALSVLITYQDSDGD